MDDVSLGKLEMLDMNQVQTGWPYELGAEDPFRMPPPHVPECPLCSGKVSRDDPAAQALDWAVRMAEADEGEPDFWKAARVAETYRGSGQADDGEVSAFVDGVAAALTDTAWFDVWDMLAEVAEETRRQEFERVLAEAEDPEAGTEDPESTPFYDPRGGHDYPDTSRPGCHVLSWEYPKYWGLSPGEGQGHQEARVGFEFCAKLVFDPDEPYDCKCCVFRQFIRKTVSPSGSQAARYRIDKGEGGVMYGGARGDGSTRDSPDNTAAEGGQYSSDGCELVIYDNPNDSLRDFSIGTEGLSFELTYDFIGAVFDRCHRMALVGARRMLLWSKGMIYESTGMIDEEQEGKYLVSYEASAATRDVPPQAPDVAWTHLNAPDGPQKEKSMPGVPIESETSNPGDPGHKITRECK